MFTRLFLRLKLTFLLLTRLERHWHRRRRRCRDEANLREFEGELGSVYVCGKGKGIRVDPKSNIQ